MAGQVGRLEMKIFRNDMHKLRNFHEAIKTELEQILPKIGAKVEATVLGHVKSQDLPWKKLSSSHLAYKAKNEYSLDTWIMTSSLTNSITFSVNKSNLSVFVGVFRSAGGHAVTGQALFEVAFALEFGNEDSGGHLPARPLFQPSLEQNKRPVETMVGIAIRKAVKKFTSGTVNPAGGSNG